MKLWIGRAVVAVLTLSAACAAADWYFSYQTTGEMTLGWRTRPDANPAAGHGRALTFLSRSGRVDASALRVNLVRAPNVLDGYTLGETTGIFWRADRHHEPPGQVDRAHFGFREKKIGYSPRATIIEGWEVRFPHSAVLLALLLLTGLTLLPAWRRRRRRLRGLCEHCGYDLRSSDERCPECGADIPPKTPKVSSDRAGGAGSTV
ncbi:MAG TPA: zinc ribbon domain-containing protein [Tepidisphaeraceae bacterium]|nr:zinc ribbon domain-containing protein [Tepidisphaeraceae bacterium]